jgi:hypothetical protein
MFILYLFVSDLDLNSRAVLLGKLVFFNLIFIRLFRPLQQEQIRPTNSNGAPKCNCDADAKELTVKKGNSYNKRYIFNGL